MATLLSIYFPFQSGVSTFPRAASDADAIKASIIQILMTRIGERVMRPTFGTRIWDFIFDNDSDSFREDVEREVRSALGQWEPRIVVTQVLVESGEVNEPNQMLVTIYYAILATGQNDSVMVAG